MFSSKLDQDEKSMRNRYSLLVQQMTDMTNISKINLTKYRSDQRYSIINTATKQVLETKDLFTDNGMLLRPDLINIDESTGLYFPKPETVLKLLSTGEIQTAESLSPDFCLSPSSGFCYPRKNNILFDPGRLRLVVFDESTTSPTENIWLIPFTKSSGVTNPSVQNPSQFRLWKDVIDPISGLKVPIIGASLVDNELQPIGTV